MHFEFCTTPQVIQTCQPSTIDLSNIISVQDPSTPGKPGKHLPWGDAYRDKNLKE